MCIDHAMQNIWMLPQAGQQSYYGRGKAGLGAVSAGLYGVRFGSLIICIPCSDLTADLLSFSLPASVPPGRFTRTVNGLVMRFSGLLGSTSANHIGIYICLSS